MLGEYFTLDRCRSLTFSEVGVLGAAAAPSPELAGFCWTLIPQ